MAACVPRFPLCGKRGSLSGGGEQCPHRVLGILYMEVLEEGRCQQEQSSVQAKFEEQSGLWTALWVFREETTLRVSCTLTAS